MRNAVIVGFKRSPFTMSRKGEMAEVRPEDILSEVIKNLVEFADKFREAATQTNGRYHFGKNDLITTYNKCVEERDGKE